MKKFILLFALLISTSALFAQTKDVTNTDWKIVGKTQIINQMDGKDFNDATHPLFLNTMKTRLGLMKSLNKDVSFVFSMQDSRVLGSEASIVAPAKNLDLACSYVSVKNLFSLPLAIKIGRFQLNYGAGRVLSNSFWNINERFFDGAMLSYKNDKFSADYFHIIRTATQGYFLKVLPGKHEAMNGVTVGKGIYGLYTNYKFNENQNVDVYGVMESYRAAGELVGETVKNTIGANYNGKFGAFSANVEGAYQMGTIDGDVVDEDNDTKDIAAYMLAADFNYKLKPVVLNFGTYMISGQETYDTDVEAKDKKVTVYGNELAAKHKFLGAMDYFLSIPAGTKNLGVNDFYFGVKMPKLMEKLSVNLTAHHFMANVPLTVGDEDLTTYGQEFDLTFAYKITKGATWKFGGAVFMAGDLMDKVWTVTEEKDMSFWAFSMLVISLK